MLETISTYNLSFDYVTEQQEMIRSMTLEEHQALAQEYIQPRRMYYVIAGDAATQMKALGDLGLGDPVLVTD
jgi:zinc protease